MLSAPIMFLDADYLLRHSRPNLCSIPIIAADEEILLYKPWAEYASYDHRYYPNDDGFVKVKCYLNLIGGVLGLVAVMLTLLDSKSIGLRMGMVVSITTMYSTIMYLFMEFIEGEKHTSHNSFMEKLLVIWLPSFILITIRLINFCQIYSAYGELMVTNYLSTVHNATMKKKKEKEM